MTPTDYALAHMRMKIERRKRVDRWIGIGGLIAAIALIASVITMADAQADEIGVDVALVLAVDVSASVDDEEAMLQRQGYALAFASKEVQDAIAAGFIGRIAVTYVEWADSHFQRTIVDWFVIEDEVTAAAFATLLAAEPPKKGGGTAIGDALLFSAGRFADLPVMAERQIIDISGDGISTEGTNVKIARDLVLAAGITINGLPVEVRPDYKAITDYYREYVVGGVGHIVITSAGGQDFVNAVRTKIALEIAGVQQRGVRKYAFVME